MKVVLILGFILFLVGGTVAGPKFKPYRAKSGAVKTSFTDQEILSAVYSNYRYPEGFYKDSAQPGESVYYINSVSTGGQRDSGSKELCTDDPVDATSWDEMTNANSSVKRFLTLMNETERYYEFVRRDTSSTVLFRVHKCSYIDVGEWDVRNEAGPIGIFNKRGFFRKDVRSLAEYLWSIHNSSNQSLKVLSSFATTRVGRFEHTMYVVQKSVIDQVKMLQGGDPVSTREVSDLTLTRLVYQVDRTSHKVSLQSKPLKIFRALSDPPEILKKPLPTKNKEGN